jgi:hypothetical protein
MKSAAAYQYQYENISSMKSWRKRNRKLMKENNENNHQLMSKAKMCNQLKIWRKQWQNGGNQKSVSSCGNNGGGNVSLSGGIS